MRLLSSLINWWVVLWFSLVLVLPYNVNLWKVISFIQVQVSILGTD